MVLPQGLSDIATIFRSNEIGCCLNFVNELSWQYNMFSLVYLVYNQFWLNFIFKDHNFGYITKLTK
jgi:hypothetical protein